MVRKKIDYESLIMLEIRVAKAIKTKMQAILGPYGVTFSQYSMLYVLEKAGRGGMYGNQLAETLVAPLSQISLLAKGLESKQLIRSKQGKDKRFRSLHITTRGRGLMDKLRHDTSLGDGQSYPKRLVDNHVELVNDLIARLTS